MKKILLYSFFILGFSFITELYAQNLPVINRAKKTFSLYMGDDDTPLIFGYETASASAAKIICFSSFTVDVENNPHKCKLGAYYSTDDITINYLGVEGDFIKLQLEAKDIFYIEKKWVKWE